MYRNLFFPQLSLKLIEYSLNRLLIKQQAKYLKLNQQMLQVLIQLQEIQLTIHLQFYLLVNQEVHQMVEQQLFKTEI